MKFALAILSLCALGVNAATIYSGPSATGNGLGGDFDNRFNLTGFTGGTRGNTYKVIEGSYGDITLGTAASGTTTITIEKVSSADSAVAGYNANLHDGQAVFGNVFHDDQYYIVNGVTRTETTVMEAPAGYGIRITAISANSIDGDNASFSQFLYCQVGGTWSTSSSPNCSDPSAALYYVYNQNNITFTRCVFHNAGVNNGAIAMMHGSSDITFDHCDFYMGWGKATIATPNAGGARHTIKYCRFWDSSRLDTCPATEGEGITCEVGSYSVGSGYQHNGHLIYGNIFYGTASGGRNACIQYGDQSPTGGTAVNCKVFNNTFVGFPEDSVLAEILLYSGSGNAAQNNLFWNTAGSASVTANTASHNVDATVNPFIAGGYPTTLDFRIAEGGQAQDVGTDVGSPYNNDPLGVVRGLDGTYDVGAYEFDGGASDTVDPTIAVTSPTSSATYDNGASSSINISGTASDNSAVTSVTWSNDRGGSGTATGTTSWSVTGIALQSGDNVITCKALDAAANEGEDILTVTYNPVSGTVVVKAKFRGISLKR